FAVGPIKIIGRRTERSVHDSPYNVKAHTAPVVSASHVLPGVFGPGFITRFSRVWNGMEYPFPLARSDVVRPDVARCCVIHLRHLPADDQQVAVHNTR